MSLLPIANGVKEWATVACHACFGHGLVSDYGATGTDFEGPKECRVCWGGGKLWRSPRGFLVLYPGGPFRGHE